MRKYAEEKFGMERQKIVAATGNAHKIKEMREILSAYEILSAKDAGFTGDVAETGETFMENALLKARAVCKETGLPALADDSGLCVKALSGAPGVYSARYSARCGFSGQGDRDRIDEANRKCLLKNMQGQEDRTAYFCCAVALVFPDGREVTAEGKSQGNILKEERGKGGFGYDCLFLSRDLNMSFAEADENRKNEVSHRGRALRALVEKLNLL